MIIDGITVKIVRKRIKNAYIRIADDYSAVISAPYGISQQTLERFFIENADGVRRAIAKKKSVAGGDYLADGYLYVFGVKKRFTISESKDNSVIETVEGVVARCSVKDRKKLDALVSAFLKRKLSERLNRLIAFWESKTGLKSSGYAIRRSESRWGSCNCSTKKLNFSLYLANMPVECVSYVVLHELCHTRYANHGEGFKATLSEYLPEWKEVRSRLNVECSKMKFLATGDCV